MTPPPAARPPLALYDLPAPAKLNLFLHVTGRRADGYHLLQSAFVLIDWADTLHLERRADGRLARHDLGPALPADDLSLRAARALQQASGCPLGADISVLKTVPWGAGLGGGSSDAATVLLGLNRLWGLHWPRERLLALATPLGADVPFFVGGENAWVEGIGEQLTPLAWSPRWYAVAKPAQPVATAGIFSHPSLPRNTVAATMESFLAHETERGWVSARPGSEQRTQRAPAFGCNNLQPVAEALCPEITQVARYLESRIGPSRMTGSGSAVFAEAGTGDRPVAADPAGSALLGDLPAGWVARMCRSLPHHPLRGWAG